MKKRNEQNTRIRRLSAVVVLVAALFSCFNAHALNTDYLDENKWLQNDNTVTVSLDKTSTVNRLTGSFQYYPDHDNLCLYTCFKVTETTLTTDNDDVRIVFKIHTAQESYQLGVTQNGAEDTLTEDDKSYACYQQFTTGKQTGKYLCTLALKSGENEHLIDVVLAVNGHQYIIEKNILLKRVPTTKATTTKLTTTRVTTTKVTTVRSTTVKVTTQRSTRATTQRAAAVKTTKATTTKFAPKGKAPTTTAQATTQFEAETLPAATTTATEVLTPTATTALAQASVTKRTATSKVMLGVGGALAGGGIILLLIAAAKKKE